VDYRKKIDIDEVKNFIRESSSSTRVYVGGDSERHKVGGVWYADYTVCVVVHKDGNKGCRVFGETVRERDYDQKKNAPRMRLMNEVYKVAELFNKIQDALGDREFEVHIDVNPKKTAGSSCVIDEAVGYIKATCNVYPLVKPDSPAATFCADRFSQIKQMEASARAGIRPMSASKLKRKRRAA
jgi:predicted RNase H-related nuclease YkuK (DUF458 family)